MRKLIRDLKGIAYVLTHNGEAVDAEGYYRGGRVVLLVRGLPGFVRMRYQHGRKRGMQRIEAVRFAVREACAVARTLR
jgi:hypothetical protein